MNNPFPFFLRIMFYGVKHEGLNRAAPLKGVKSLKTVLKLTENVFRHAIESSFPKKKVVIAPFL